MKPMDQDKLETAAQLEAQAKQLRREAFAERPLPDHWRVGDRIRYIRNKEHCCEAGALGVVVEVEHPERPAAEYQVFYTRPDGWTTTLGGTARFYTTPDEVELVLSDSDGVGQSDGPEGRALPKA